MLIDARKEITFPTTSVVTRRKTIREDRDTVMRFVRSHVEAIAFHKQNKEFSVESPDQVRKNHRPGVF